MFQLRWGSTTFYDSCPSKMAEEPASQTGDAKSRIGQVIAGKFTLESLLGVGGMAAVYASQSPSGETGGGQDPPL